MKIKHIGFLFLFFCITTQSIYAQWDAQMSQYWRARNYYNPSFAGDANMINTMLMHRQQWIGVHNAPKTSILSVTMPIDFLGRNHGVGILMFNEKIGLFSNTIMAGQYAYKLNIKKKGKLNIGLQAGMSNVDFDANAIHIPESNYHNKDDDAIPTGNGGKIIDASLGISWITPRYWLGFSSSHLWDPSVELDDNHTTYLARSYYLMGGYNITLNNPLIVLKPSAFFKTDAVTYQIDVTAMMEYKKTFNGGISWRKDDGFVFLLGIKIKNIDAFYSYDLSTSAIGRASGGSHEISIGYNIPLENKVNRSSKKSVRIL